jgi:hypothetical protein
MAEIEEMTHLNTPEEIHKYMSKNYKSPTEKEINRLKQYCESEFDLKWFTDENFKHLMCTGKEVFKVNIYDGYLSPEIVNISRFDYDIAPHKMFIEDAEWAKYYKDIDFSDIFLQFGDQILPKHLKILDSLYTGGHSGVNAHRIGSSSLEESRLIAAVSSNMDNYGIRNIDLVLSDDVNLYKIFVALVKNGEGKVLETITKGRESTKEELFKKLGISPNFSSSRDKSDRMDDAESIAHALSQPER